jgi:ABC-type nitrate/sulfonate/bicarbonate transport system substrate-binding protein
VGGILTGAWNRAVEGTVEPEDGAGVRLRATEERTVSMIDRLGRLAKSPQAQQALQKATARAQQFATDPKNREAVQKMATKAQQFANDPKNRQRIEDVRRRFTGGSGGGTPRPR